LIRRNSLEDRAEFARNTVKKMGQGSAVRKGFKKTLHSLVAEFDDTGHGIIGRADPKIPSQFPNRDRIL
jgi:hypothetical protein